MVPLQPTLVQAGLTVHALQAGATNTGSGITNGNSGRTRSWGSTGSGYGTAAHLVAAVLVQAGATAVLTPEAAGDLVTAHLVEVHSAVVAVHAAHLAAAAQSAVAAAVIERRQTLRDKTTNTLQYEKKEGALLAVIVMLTANV